MAARPSASGVAAVNPSSAVAREHVERGAAEVAEPRRLEGGLRSDARGLGARLVEREHRRLRAAPDVEDAAALVRRRGEQRRDDVADVDEVAGLQAVAEDRRPVAACEPVEEDRDHATFEARRLTRAEDVREPRDHVARAVDPVEALQVLLAAELRDPVGRERQARALLGRRAGRIRRRSRRPSR